MSRITSIKPQKSKKRVNIYLDGRFAFGIDLDNLVKFGLEVEQVLTGKEVEAIINKAEFQKTFDKLIRFTTLRPRSEKEIDTWLRKYRVHSSLHTKLFNKLKRLDLLNDLKFAEWWVEQRVQFKSKSKREIIYELKGKGIDKNIIDDVLFKIDIDEAKSARKLLLKNKYRWQRFKEFEKRKKMSDFLGRKGFGWEVIRKVVKDY